ncbi:MAG: SprT-like domain-containing protein [Bacteroidota bacterium]|jgi:hypothetical protein
MGNFSSLILGELTVQQHQHKLSLMEALKKHIPPPALELCCELIMYYRLHLHIEVERKDRYGDYHPHLGKGNRISVNHNLPPFEFLITFIHELAHHTTWLKYGNQVQPHGKEWKEEFKRNMFPFMQIENLFPHDVKFAIIGHMRSPKYSHSADVKLMKVLMRYDTKKNYLILDDLKEGDLFVMEGKSKIILKKQETLRTYINCLAVATGKKYQVHALAKVKLIQRAS